MGLENVKRIVIVMSGKGGVGKSTISTLISMCMSKSGLKVGILDCDICGPSIPCMFGLSSVHIYQGEGGWIPVSSFKVKCMSTEFLLEDPADAIVWKGPKKWGMIKQLLFSTDWGDLDYLIVDTPPGTSDEHLAIASYLKDYSVSVIVVTTPQRLSISDVIKQLDFCHHHSLSIFGIIENMSGYPCEHCNWVTNLLSSFGGESLSNIRRILLLGRIPIDRNIGVYVDGNSSFEEIPQASFFDSIVKKILEAL